MLASVDQVINFTPAFLDELHEITTRIMTLYISFYLYTNTFVHCVQYL